MIYEGNCNTELVCTYFNNILKKIKDKSVIIMDNASYHKSARLEEIFDKHNHLLVFLPPYSPELNPIELLWGILKRNPGHYFDDTKDLLENLKIQVCKLMMG